MNKVILSGNIGKDPEYKQNPNGTEFVKFSLATTERFKDKDEEWKDKTTWHNVVIWGKRGKFIADYGKKGIKAVVEGKIDYTEHEGKYYTNIIANNIELMLPPKNNSQNAPVESKTVTENDLPF